MHTQMQYPTPLPEGTAMNVEGIYVCAVASLVIRTSLFMSYPLTTISIKESSFNRNIPNATLDFCQG